MEIQAISPFRPDASALLEQSDALMAELYPADSNHLESADVLAGKKAYFIGLFTNATDDNLGELAGIGAVMIRQNRDTYGEIKRVFIAPAHRGNGYAHPIMAALESHLVRQCISIARLETGIRQPAAINLYKSNGYVECEPFGHYQADPLSLFMQKSLTETI